MNLFSSALSFASLAIVATSCSNSGNFEVFGENFEQSKVMSSSDLNAVFDKLEIGDTAEVIFNTKIDAVCQKKGCWMDVELSDEEVARVTFLDYGFFVPLNSSGSEAVVKGKAFWKSDSEAEKRHYAEDAGQAYNAGTDENFEEYMPHIVATGVLIKK